jgi:hypothetical protein
VAVVVNAAAGLVARRAGNDARKMRHEIMQLASKLADPPKEKGRPGVTPDGLLCGCRLERRFRRDAL